MKGPAIRSTIAFALLAATFIWAAVRVSMREVRERVLGDDTLRVAHNILDPGFRQAMQELASAYEAMKAADGVEVRVEVIEVPSNVYPQWVRTQLVGRTAPEIVVNSWEFASDLTLVARYFEPLHEKVSEPNPYNAGSSLAGMRWRDTFIDGMDFSGFNFELAEHYGIPVSASTYRMIANRALLEQLLARPGNAALREALGPTLVPKTYEQFISICEAVPEFARKRGIKLIPIAGSRDGGRKLLQTLVGSQTQGLLIEWQRMADLRVTITDMLDNAMADETTLQHPAFLLGFELQREVGQFIQPGFLQLRREDANFAFAAQNALMVLVTSLDAASLRTLTEGQFETIVFDLPLPLRSHPHFGAYSVGEISEAETAGSSPFAIVNFHPVERRELALDFLQFLTSREANEHFAMISGQLPVVIDARTAPQSEGFMPRISGFPLGPLPDFNDNELRTILDRHRYLLFSPNGTAGTFARETEQAMLRELPGILTRLNERGLNGVAGQDALIASHHWLRTFVPAEVANSERKLDILIDSSDGNEATGTFTLSKLRAWQEDAK